MEWISAFNQMPGRDCGTILAFIWMNADIKEKYTKKNSNCSMAIKFYWIGVMHYPHAYYPFNQLSFHDINYDCHEEHDKFEITERNFREYLEKPITHWSIHDIWNWIPIHEIKESKEI